MNSGKKDLERRVIIHLDLDAFYAQVERRRLGLSNDTPVAVQQHNMLIAVGYAARKFGVQRIQSATEAKQLCPDLVLAQVEMKDNVVSLERYRNASLEIFDVLKTFKMCKLEKAGTDEAFLDATEYINERIKNGGKITTSKQSNSNQNNNQTTSTIQQKQKQQQETDQADDDDDDDDDDENEILSQFQDEEDEEEEENNELFNDQSIPNNNNKNNNVNNNTKKIEIAPAEEVSSLGHIEGWNANELFTNDKKLYYGALLANEIRQKILNDLTFTCSAGISHCKLLSKVGSARHKPFQQTTIPQHKGEAVLGGLAIKKLRGLGGKFGSQVKAMGIESVKQLQEVSYSTLESKFGRETARWLYDYCRGIDYDEIIERDKVRSHGSMTSFRATNDREFIKKRLASCAEKIAERIIVDHQRYNRLPKTLALHFASRASNRWTSRSKSCPMPSNRSANSLLQVALDLLKAAGPGIYPISHVGLVAHNFEEIQSVSLDNFFKQIPKGSQKNESLFKSLQPKTITTSSTTATPSTTTTPNKTNQSDKGKLKFEPKKETTSNNSSTKSSNSPFSSNRSNSDTKTTPIRKQPIFIDLESEEFNSNNESKKDSPKRKNETNSNNDINNQKKQKLSKSSNNNNGFGSLLNYFGKKE